MPTKIAWTDESWNPVTGCTPVSEGCAHCYARTFAERFRGVPGHPYQQGFDVTLHPDRLEIPLHWRKPRMVFVPSMGDLFHEDVPDAFLAHVFAIMERLPWHTFQVLTKRAERMRDFMTEWNPPHGPHKHLWLGVSVENQARADERIPLLLETPAAVRFVSAEPLLGPLNLWRPLKIYGHRGLPCCTQRDGWHRLDELGDRNPPLLDWCIVGGESGGPPERRLVERCPCVVGWPEIKGAGAYHPARAATWTKDECTFCEHTGWRPRSEAIGWVRSIREQCQAAGVALFFKGWGGRTPGSGGCKVDGREHKEMPEVRA